MGTGWQREEYEAVGLDWAERNRRLDDAIRICRKLWGEQPVDLSSERMTLDRVWALPRPVQRRIPLLFGVRLTAANVGRIAELRRRLDAGGGEPGTTWPPVPIGFAMRSLLSAVRRTTRSFTSARPASSAPTAVSTRIASPPPLAEMVVAAASVVTVVLPAGLATVDDALGFVADLGACA